MDGERTEVRMRQSGTKGEKVKGKTSCVLPTVTQACEVVKKLLMFLYCFLSPRGNPACRGSFGGRRKAVRDRLALQGGTGDFP